MDAELGIVGNTRSRLLDIATGQALFPASSAVRNSHRQAEFSVIQEPIELVDDLRDADGSVTVQAVHELRVMFSGRVVPQSRCKHSTGELAHYFDGIWVLSGRKDSHVRMVFLRDGITSRLLPLHYCSGLHEKVAYSSFLNVLEQRWYYIKAEG